MLERMIAVMLNKHGAVLALMAGVLGAGIFAVTRLPIDAFPDTTPVQVQINTVAPALPTCRV